MTVVFSKLSEEGCQTPFESSLVQSIKSVPLKDGIFYSDHQLSLREHDDRGQVIETEIM